MVSTLVTTPILHKRHSQYRSKYE
eukprot:COSAG04_NODE_3828_length_2491_cov_1.304766_3_plen_23_part_01